MDDKTDKNVAEKGTDTLQNTEILKKAEKKQEKKEIQKMKKSADKIFGKRYLEKQLKPYQAELIQMQRYLEETKTRMVILFEGRDASGKGGTIRRVARYMNEKHYRIVALGKPTEHQKTQWFFQKYIQHYVLIHV